MDSNLIKEIVKIIFPTGLSLLGLLIFIVFFPEKVEKWQKIIWGWLENIGLLYKTANKSKIKHSIQSNVSSFAKYLSNELPEFDPPRVRIDWIDDTLNKKAFFERNKAVIRLRRNDPHNDNVVNACMLYVSKILLKKSGRYLGDSQKKSLQLYIGFKMLDVDFENVYDVFVDKWLYPSIEKKNIKISDYFERYKLIDNTKYFFPIFLQEIIYMGQKVFARRRDDGTIVEFNGALEFLEEHANRKIGELLEKPFYAGIACKFAIMIIGISKNVEEERYLIYLNHIQNTLMPCGVETIYLIGPTRYARFIDEISAKVVDHFYNPFTRKYIVSIKNRDGNLMQTENILSVLRKRQKSVYVS